MDGPNEPRSGESSGGLDVQGGTNVAGAWMRRSDLFAYFLLAAQEKVSCVRGSPPASNQTVALATQSRNSQEIAKNPFYKGLILRRARPTL